MAHAARKHRSPRQTTTARRHEPAVRQFSRDLYASPEWKAGRRQHLNANPWCVECLKTGRHKPATHVDHRTPHRGDLRLFWDRSNWDGLCHRCHSAKTARQDGGFGNERKPTTGQQGETSVDLTAGNAPDATLGVVGTGRTGQ